VSSTPDPNGFARELFSGLPARYDSLAELLSFGQNRRWRRFMVDRLLAVEPSSVLDVATGTAGLALLLADRSPSRSRIVGLDLSEPMLRRGQANVGRAGRSDQVRLLLGRAEALPFPDATFDALAFTYLLRYVADPLATLRELARVVRPGGLVVSLEFGVPANRFWRAGWWLYTRLLLPIAAALAGRAWRTVGLFLGPSISRHHRRYPVPWMIDAWRQAGLADVRLRSMSLGGGLIMWGRKADGR
jgi:demethylmenaquinone methyltransferase/2-methoxy-6-polyprenyl-1,4-benzoquinol methylase